MNFLEIRAYFPTESPSVPTMALTTILLAGRPSWWQAFLSLTLKNKSTAADVSKPNLRLPICLNIRILKFLYKEAHILFGGFKSPQLLARFYPIRLVSSLPENTPVFIVTPSRHSSIVHSGKSGRAFRNGVMLPHGLADDCNVLCSHELNPYEQSILRLVCLRIFFDKQFIPLYEIYDPVLLVAAKNASFDSLMPADRTGAHDPKHLDYAMKLVFYITGFCGFMQEAYDYLCLTPPAVLAAAPFTYMPYCVWGHFSGGMTFEVPTLPDEEHCEVLRVLASHPTYLDMYSRDRKAKRRKV